MNNFAFSLFWLPASLLLWIVGYFSTLFTQNDVENKIHVPLWMFYLCGAPKTKQSSPGFVNKPGFAMQLLAILLLSFSLALDVFQIPISRAFGNNVIFGISLMLCFYFMSRLSKPSF